MNDKIISIQNLLLGRNADFDKATKIKLVRHKDKRPVDQRIIMGIPYRGSLYHLYQTEHERFPDYQREQKRNQFEGVEYIVSFIGEEGLESRFVGVFKNNGVLRPSFDDVCIFDFQEIDCFEILK